MTPTEVSRAGPATVTVLTVADPTRLAAIELVALGTTGRLVVTVPTALDQATDILVRGLEEIERAASRFRDDSDLSRVNRAAGRPVTVSSLLVTAVEVALRAARLTGGDVDPTVGQAMRLVGYDRHFADLEPGGPPLRMVAQPVPGWRTVTVDRGARTVRVPPGVELDLGATAKALAADRIAARVGDATGAGVLVSLGGDIAVAGVPPEGGWAIRVADDHRFPDGRPEPANSGPRIGAYGNHFSDQSSNGPGAPMVPAGQTVAIRTGGLATSSTTVRQWQRGHRVLHHLLDPATGQPVEGPWRTVSVAGASCVDANTASTAAMVRGTSAVDWLTAMALPARLVGHDGQVVTVGDWPPEAL